MLANEKSVTSMNYLSGQAFRSISVSMSDDIDVNIVWRIGHAIGTTNLAAISLYRELS